MNGTLAGNSIFAGLSTIMFKLNGVIHGRCIGNITLLILRVTFFMFLFAGNVAYLSGLPDLNSRGRNGMLISNF